MSKHSRRPGAGRGGRTSRSFYRPAAAAAAGLKRWAAALAGAGALGALPAAPAYAISAGCAAANAGSFNSVPAPTTSTFFTSSFEGGEKLNIVFNNVNGAGADQATDITAGVTFFGPVVGQVTASVSYTIPASGSRTFLVEIFGTGPSRSITITCTPLAASGSDLGPTAKLLTEFVLGQILPERTQALSDVVNGRLLGTNGGPQFSENGGSLRFRMSLADLRRMSRPANDTATKTSQWAIADRGTANPDRALGDRFGARSSDRAVGRDRAKSDDQLAASAAPSPAKTFRETLDGQRWNVWAVGSIFGVDVNRTGAAFDGRLYSVLGGVDVKVFEQLLVGVAGGWERYDLDTGFNGGTFKGTGYTVGPYAGVKLAPFLVLDVWGGWTRVNYDLTSRATGTTETGSFDANRYFVSGNLTGHIQWGDLRISPRAGVLYANERQPAYTSSLGNAVAAQTIQLGKAMFGPEVAYRIALPDWRMTVEPFAFIRGEYDFVRNGSTTLGTTVIRPERWGARAGGGLGIAAFDRVSLRLGASYDSIGRSHEQVIRGEARLSIRF